MPDMCRKRVIVWARSFFQRHVRRERISMRAGCPDGGRYWSEFCSIPRGDDRPYQSLASLKFVLSNLSMAPR